MIIRIVQLTFQEHLVDEFIKTFEVNSQKIRAFEGCHGVELVQDMYRPYVFFTLSKWESEEALNAYRESDLFRNTWKVTKSLFSVPAHAWSTTDTGK
ncbi:MAG: antibiotic biosynthesis monooxygenase [Flavobacteriales bacterium]|nr:antibiotic biosynthesis monooxygenase [Flavobacteriales bacterium]